MRPNIILTCEHGGTDIPKSLSKVFHPQKQELFSHTSYDYGVKNICLTLQKEKHIYSVINSTTRLLIDMNREIDVYKKKQRIHQSNGFSELQLKIPEAQYYKYRQQVETLIQKQIQKRKPFYVFSVHSFVSEINGKKRSTDIGLLFRKNKPKEVFVAKKLKAHLKGIPSLKYLNIHFNRPYRGHTDCFLNDLLDKYGDNPFCLGGCFLEFSWDLLKAKKPRVVLELIEFFKKLD